MSEHTPINPNAPKAGAPHAVRKMSCEEWEALLADFLDGTLPSSETDSFHVHEKTCASCAEMFSQAGQGREWLGFLRIEPQIPPGLVTRILAQTSGGAVVAGLSDQLAPSAAVVPPPMGSAFWKSAGMMAAGRRVAQPRMMMTAAMAFFSITLTLNMAGVRLSAIRLADLKPSALSSNLNKQYHMASARVVRYYDNWRFLYEMEARVKELRRDADLGNTPTDQPTAPSSAPQDAPRKNGGKSEGPSAQKPQAMLWGERVEAALRAPLADLNTEDSHHGTAPEHSEGRMEVRGNRAADQAERGIA
jgi:hypothetical protein